MAELREDGVQEGVHVQAFLRPLRVLRLREQEPRRQGGQALRGRGSGTKAGCHFFTQAPDGHVERVNKDSLAKRQELLTIAEILQACGFALPPDPERTAATAELLLEAQHANLDIARFVCVLEEQAEEVHVYKLEDEVNAEAALALELSPASRTKMLYARLLQRNAALLAGETLDRAWSCALAHLQNRAAPFLPAPPPAAPPAAAAAAPAAGRGARGRGRGRGRGR